MCNTIESGKRVVVAGATGYLGKHVVRALHRNKWSVVALARNRDRLAEVASLCDEIYVAEATQRESLGNLFKGAFAVFSSIGIRHLKRHPTYEEVDYQANINLVEEAEKAGVERFMFVSVLEGNRHRKLSPLLDARERVVDRLRNSPMQSIILRPTGFFNDMGDIFKMAQKGKVWIIGSGETKVNPIHGADLADVAAQSLLGETPDAEIPAGGPDIFSQQEIAELVFRILESPPRYGHVKPGLIRFLAHLARPFNKNASALAMMFSLLGTENGVAPCYGTHHLKDFFFNLANAKSGVTEDGHH